MLATPREAAQRLLEDLRVRVGNPALDFAEPPALVRSGNENLIANLRLSGAPPSLVGPLVLRLYPPERDPSAIRLEAALHRAVLAQGYPAPRVALLCDDPAPVGGAYMLMERVPGRVLLGEVAALDEAFAGPRATARSVARMVYEGSARVPRDLAHMMLRLHALDPGPILDAADAAGFPGETLSAGARLERIQGRAEKAALDGLMPALAWLQRRYREPERLVLCHSDIHFLNLLVAGREVTGVLDWSCEHVTFADPAFDVGNTRALLDITLPGIPALFRPAFRAVQAYLLARFTSLYRRERPVDPEAVRWAEVFRLVREMVHAGEAVRRGEAAPGRFLGSEENPWLIPVVRDGVLAGIEQRCGERAWLPESP